MLEGHAEIRRGSSPEEMGVCQTVVCFPVHMSRGMPTRK